MKINLFRKSYLNYLDLHILIPVIEIAKPYVNCIGEEDYYSGLVFNTEINYIKSNIGWSFKLVVLGFGITINRQFTY